MDLLKAVDDVTAKNDAIFGSVGGPVNVIVFALGGMTDGTGGADHMSCDFISGQNIEVCASFGQSDRVIALFEAELSECSMGGNLCGNSVGEGLSRWCARVVSNNALSDFDSGPYWFQNGMANWVDQTDANDRSYDSIGCAVVFISWLMGRTLAFTLSEIAQFMVKAGDSGTLADLYHALTSLPATKSAWVDFQAAIAALPGGVTSDDPFGAMSTPNPNPTPAPGPGPAPVPAPAPTTSMNEKAALYLFAIAHHVGNEDTTAELDAAVQEVHDA